MSSEFNDEAGRLLNQALNLAIADNCPTAGMRPMGLMVSTLSVAAAHRTDADAVMAVLIATLSWVARENWADVSAEIRAVEGSTLQ